MVFDSLHHHGGRLEDARTAFSVAPEPWLDLSTGVNPYPWHGEAGTADLARLPDPALRRRLETTAAVAFGTAAASVVAVPGADSALRMIPAIVKASRVAIVSPTYGGHGEAWRAAGAEVSYISGAQLGDVEADAVVVVNPNNPDGKFHKPQTLIDLAGRLAARDGWLIVDESFAEVMPEISVANYARGRLVVLRSFGKFYGLPGARLGFVVADPDVIALFRPLLGDWPVSAQAIALGTKAYADTAWQTSMGEQLTREIAELDQLLVRTGFTILGGTALFRLVTRPDARNVFHRLGESGILVRPFADQPHWLRIGLPPRPAWDRVATALEALP